MKDVKNKIIGASVTVVVHLLIILLLVYITVDRPTPQEEGGVEVMLGFVSLAEGDMEPAAGEPMDVEQEPELSVDTDEPQMITQNDEPSVAVQSKKKDKEETKPVKKEKTEEEKRKEHEQKVAAQADKLISGAFGKGNTMGSNGKSGSGKGTQGSVDGNSSSGKTSGVGGYGSFDLDGRSLGSGRLPAPSYNVKEEGTVVVNIWVNPAGHVVRTSINPRSNTSSVALRTAAEKAAKQARFNTVSSVDIQQGTITYVFNLK